MTKLLAREREIAKQLKLSVERGHLDAMDRCARFIRNFQPSRGLSLASAQLVVARENGFVDWGAMVADARGGGA